MVAANPGLQKLAKKLAARADAVAYRRRSRLVPRTGGTAGR